MKPLTGYTTLLIGVPCDTPQVTCIFFIYQYTQPFLTIENTMANRINATYIQCKMVRLGIIIPLSIQQSSFILIAGIFY